MGSANQRIEGGPQPVWSDGAAAIKHPITGPIQYSDHGFTWDLANSGAVDGTLTASGWTYGADWINVTTISGLTVRRYCRFMVACDASTGSNQQLAAVSWALDTKPA